MKLLRSLPPAWNNIALIIRNKLDIETLSMDDLYNNLKVYEAEIKGQSSLSSNSYNVAFLSSENTSNINETINTIHDRPATGSKEQPFASRYADDVMFYFFASQSNTLQLDNEDLEQIDTDDLEEIHLKCQVSANEKTGLGYDSQLSENEMSKCEIFKAASDSSVSEINEDNNQAKDKPKVNTAVIRLNVNVKSSYFKPHSPKRRHFNQKSVAKTNTFSRKINTAKGKNATTARPKAVVNAAEGKKENAVKSSAC
uniref:Uncharacterized protein n=1 Tax=Tanacetum cinerariifolium TaxID=118510 RepID=A0A699K2N0_TANCI|nr:hypothetical protein [Tanacetum cinerariifolium]